MCISHTASLLGEDYSFKLVTHLKSSYIKASEPKILATLGINIDDWLTAVKHFRRQYSCFAGTVEHLRDFAHQHSKSWCKYSS